MGITSMPEFAGGPVGDFMLARRGEIAKAVAEMATEGPGTYEENLAVIKREVMRMYHETFGPDVELTEEA